MDFLVENMSEKWTTKLEHLEISTKLQIPMEWVMTAMDQIQKKMLKVTMANGNIQLKRNLFWWLKKLNMQINWKERCQLKKQRVNITQINQKCHQQVVYQIFHQGILQLEVQKISSSIKEDLAWKANHQLIKNKHRQNKIKKRWRVQWDQRLRHYQGRMKLYRGC